MIVGTFLFGIAAGWLVGFMAGRFLRRRAIASVFAKTYSCPACGKQTHPAVSLWRCDCGESLTGPEIAFEARDR